MIRVVIGDDHAVVREGLRRILGEQTGIEVVGEGADGVEVVAIVKDLRPDVVLLDISMPRRDGIDATREITAMENPPAVLILTMHSDEHYALRALRAGALGFVLKDAKADEVITAVHRVHEGRRYLPPGLERSFAERYLEPRAGTDRANTLSKREFEVLCLLAMGMTNREIADKLRISIKTVDSHRRHVLKKLNLRNNSDLTRFAIQNGYVQV